MFMHLWKIVNVQICVEYEMKKCKVYYYKKYLIMNTMWYENIYVKFIIFNHQRGFYFFKIV